MPRAGNARGQGREATAPCSMSSLIGSPHRPCRRRSSGRSPLRMLRYHSLSQHPRPSQLVAKIATVIKMRPAIRRLVLRS